MLGSGCAETRFCGQLIADLNAPIRLSSYLFAFSAANLALFSSNCLAACIT
jgi:hypothetical protein